MIMENKYYVPDITEFRVGFEVFVGELPSIITEESLKLILNYVTKDLTICNHGQSVFKLPIEPIRVKYLDREDIESFGFTLVKEYSDELVFQINDGEYCFYELTLNIDDNKVNIEQGCQSKMSANKLPIEQWNYFNIFFGEIKNKSELQQVLKMIGVIQ